MGAYSWIWLGVYPWTRLRWVAIKCFDVAIRVHTWSEGSPNVAPRFCSRLDLRINILCFLWSIAYHWVLWELAAFFKLDQLSYFCIFLFILRFIFNGFKWFWFLFRAFSLKQHFKNFVNNLGGNNWCSVGLTVALLDFLSVICNLGSESWRWSLWNVPTSIVKREFFLVFIDNGFDTLTAVIFILLGFIVLSFFFLDNSALNFDWVDLFLSLSEFFNRSDVFDTSKNGRERLLTRPIRCLVSWCTLWNRSLVDAIISSKATACTLVSLESFSTSKCLRCYFTAVFISVFRWGHICLHLWLWGNPVVIGNISSRSTELRLWLLHIFLIGAHYTASKVLLVTSFFQQRRLQDGSARLAWSLTILSCNKQVLKLLFRIWIVCTNSVGQSRGRRFNFYFCLSKLIVFFQNKGLFRSCEDMLTQLLA